MADINTIEGLQQENRKLRNSVSELSEFIDKASLSLHWVNSEGIIIWANQAELDLLGYTPQEYIGKPIRNFHADQEIIADILQMLAADQRIIDRRATLICKNGDLKYVNINSSALMKDSEFVHSMCFTKDITEAVLAEQKKDKLTAMLGEKEERLRLAIVSSGMGTWDWDSASAKVSISERSQHILGLPNELCREEQLIDLVHPEDRPTIFKQIEELSERKTDGHFDFTCRIINGYNGLIAFIRVQGSAYFSRSEHAGRIIGTIIDITDQKRAVERSAELVAIVNSSYDAIIGKTLQGIITSWNAAAEKLFGYSSKEMVGQSILKLIPEERHAEENYILDRLRRGHSIKHFETVRRTKSGKLIDLSLTISPIKNDLGEIIGISKIARDITAKKQEEHRKNVFISMASHELKTPLTSVLLSAQIMQQHKELFGEKSASMGSKIENQVKKMMLMIGDFLSVAEVEQGKLQLNRSSFNLRELMRDCIADLGTHSHSIELSCDASSELFADRPKIDQVLGNLLSNAVKYSPKGGTITIGAESVDGKIRIFVRDQGLGIEKKHQKNLFKAFYRVDNLNTSYISGFGIGLYIVAEILRCHGTKIQLESEKDKGSTFYFDLNIPLNSSGV
ncbi:PAS domain S-box protein [Sphingobacterium sp.]|uniref:PAS domain-containing sensor histidine kinase n=1 Tax=Sphingobacterium sp. TaxID=341027 RepID=UPI0025881B72|nr:PAS domain S-box protein [Sphingobacterium sp.]WET68011.1 MAG: PAS domain S-box protein [Sphingobacterium sp.]